MALYLLKRLSGRRALSAGLLVGLLTTVPAAAQQYCTSNLQLNTTCSMFEKCIQSVQIPGTALSNLNTGYNGATGYVSWPEAGHTTARLTVGRQYALQVRTTSGGTIGAWLDSNRNGQLEASEFILVQNNGQPGATATVRFTVPINAGIGRALLRIRSGVLINSLAPTDACTPRVIGETEDYYVRIQCVLGVVPAAASSPVCLGQPLTLSVPSAPAGTTYAWTGPNGFTSTDPTPTIPNLIAGAVGTYSATITTPSCTGTAAVAVSLSPGPSAAFNYASPAFCQGAPTTYPTITGVRNGRFSGSAGLVISPLTGGISLVRSTLGTHQVTYTVAGVCPGTTGTSTTSITISAPPAVAITNLDATYCDGGPPIPLTGTVNGQPATGTFMVDGQPATVFDPGYLNPRAHVVTFTAGVPGCSATVQQQARVLPIPVAPTITARTLPSGLLELSATRTHGNQWYRNGQPIAGAYYQTHTVDPATQSGVYTVVLTINGCSSVPSAPFNVSVTGVADARAADAGVRLYPVPSPDGRVTLEIAGSPPTAPVAIYDATGRRVWHNVLAAEPADHDRGVGTYALDLRALPAGLYVLRLTTAHTTVVRRLVRE